MSSRHGTGIFSKQEADIAFVQARSFPSYRELLLGTSVFGLSLPEERGRFLRPLQQKLATFKVEPMAMEAI